MAVQYTLTKTSSGYTLANTGANDISYRLDTVKDGDIVEGSTSILAAEVTAIFSLPKDDIYTLVVTDLVDNSTEAVEIKSFSTLLGQIVDKTLAIVCECENCGDCADECDTRLEKLLAMYNAYLILYYVEYNNKVISYLDILNSEVTTAVQKFSTQSVIRGAMETNEIALRVLGALYSAFYNVELEAAYTDAQKLAVKTKYKYSTIKECFKSKGVVLDLYSTSTTSPTVNPGSTVVYYWQLGTYTEAIEDVLATLAISGTSYLDTKPFDTLSNFNTGVTINYFNFAKIVFVVRTTSPINYVISDALDNDITALFDTSYSYELKALVFVSKSSYSSSSIKFKINVGSAQ